ncbi:MAG: MBOAT family protein [Deltaproteobacteria bacterium]|nr:MBOAT family protein [Deltaproteobacteria bacterium]
MLFNSLVYLGVFLPLVAVLFYLLGLGRRRWLINLWLVLASLFFYSYWEPKFLPVLLASIAVNFIISRLIFGALKPLTRKSYLILGLCFNVGLLGFFKYTNFVLENISWLFPEQAVPGLNVLLPLGISFFTFQQIAFLVDTYKGICPKYNPLDYSLFVSFFPQLIAGPIVHHSEMMVQFSRKDNAVLDWSNIYRGLFLIAIGLFKKLAVADTFAIWVNQGFQHAFQLGFWEAWRTSLSFSIQIYFDFSGYTDIALGSALLFNICLPLNFNSPYLAVNIQDFWRRWHMTLSRFLRDYVYIPLGGNRKGSFRILTNLFITFLIGGIWHGAGWTFVIWGALHGAAMVLHRLAGRLGLRLPSWAGWFLTFMFVNLAWVFFRASSISEAVAVISAMTNLSRAFSPEVQSLLATGPWLDLSSLLWLIPLLLYMGFDIFGKNSQEVVLTLRPKVFSTCAGMALMFTAAMMLMLQSHYSEFLYFEF